MLTVVLADATDVIATGIAYFILFGLPLIAFIFWWDYRRWRKAQRRAWLQSVVNAPQTADAFGSLPVARRFGFIATAQAFDAQDADLYGSQISYVAGRYPEPGVQRMMLNGRDYPLDDRQREELAVWGTVDGIPIEDFDDWSDWG